MMVTHGFRRVSAAGVLALTIVSAASCSYGSSSAPAGLSGSTAGADLSRTKLYDGVAALAKDSSEIVTVSVTDRSSVADIEPTTKFTLSTATVTSVVKSVRGLAPGASIIVRQTGSPGESGAAPFLEEGRQYLLFLTPSGLERSRGDQYYVTGAEAGLYEAAEQRGAAQGSEHGATYVQMQRDEDDDLPATLSPDQIAG